MTNCLWELQQAVYEELESDSTLAEMVTGVYSHVPQDTDFPYVVIGKIDSKNILAEGLNAEEVILPVNVFSRYRGAKEIVDIISEIRRILQDSQLTMTGCIMPAIRFDSYSVSRSDDFEWEGEVNFKVIIEEE